MTWREKSSTKALCIHKTSKFGSTEITLFRNQRQKCTHDLLLRVKVGKLCFLWYTFSWLSRIFVWVWYLARHCPKRSAGCSFGPHYYIKFFVSTSHSHRFSSLVNIHPNTCSLPSRILVAKTLCLQTRLIILVLFDTDRHTPSMYPYLVSFCSSRSNAFSEIVVRPL